MKLIQLDKEWLASNEHSFCRLTKCSVGNVLWVSSLFTDVRFCRKNSATDLMNEVERFAEERGFLRISLQANKSQWMVKWYMRIGYEIIAEYDDMVIMSKRVAVNKEE